MDETRYPALSEIRAAHAPRREYERYLFANRFLFRPLSFYATWLLVRLGVSSEAASWLSGLAALSGFACLLRPGGPLLWPGVFLLWLFNFFDCVDGGIARIMRTRNPYGHFLDSIMWWADMLFWTVIGFTVYRLEALRLPGDPFGIAPATWIAVGVVSAFLAAYAAYLESVFDHLLRAHWETLLGREGVKPASTPIAGKSGPEVFVRVLVHNLRVRETHYVLLAAACALGCVDLLLAFFLAVNAAVVISLLFTYCRRGRKIYEAGLGRDVFPAK